MMDNATPGQECEMASLDEVSKYDMESIQDLYERGLIPADADLLGGYWIIPDPFDRLRKGELPRHGHYALVVYVGYQPDLILAGVLLACHYDEVLAMGDPAGLCMTTRTAKLTTALIKDCNSYAECVEGAKAALAEINRPTLN